MAIIKKSKMVFPSLMDEILNPDWFGGLETVRRAEPSVNIIENEKDFVLELIVPGRNKEDFNIEIDSDVLTVSATANEEGIKGNYTRKEFLFASFKRAFTLPETIEEDKIQAAYVNGVLRFAIPKKEDSLPRPKRSIALK